jgi:PST family polysaccharide transporter
VNIIPAFFRRSIEHRPNLTKIVDNIGWLVLDKILRMGVGLVVGVWIARYLGPAQFGLLAFATAFIGLFSAFAGLGLQGIVVRDLAFGTGCKEETLGTVAGLQFISGVLAYGLIVGTIYWLRPDDALSQVLVAILGSTMLFKVSEIAIYWFESRVLSKYMVLVQDASLLAFAVIKVILILNKAPLIAFAFVSSAEALIVAMLMFVMLNRNGPKLRELRFTIKRAKGLLVDSWSLMLSGIAIMVYMKIDQIMLGQMLGDEAVGIYSAALRVSEVWYVIPMMIVSSVFPAIVETKKRSEALYYQRLQQLYTLLVGISVGVALPMTFLSTPIVMFLFGEAFAESGSVLAIHIWATVFVSLGVSSGKWLIIEGFQILALKRNLYGAIINVILNLVLIPAYQAIGAAVASLLAYMISYYFMDAFDARTRYVFFQKTYAMFPVLKLIKCNKRAS